MSRISNNTPNWDPSLGADAANASSVVFEIKKKRVKITSENIRSVAKGMAEVAYSLGQTNDEKEFADMMEEDILEAFKKAKKKREKRKRGRG